MLFTADKATRKKPRNQMHRYETGSASLMETWRFRLSLLRRTSSYAVENPHSGDVRNIAGQDLAHLALLLRSLWHMIRWDEILSEPAESEHVLDEDGHPCLREVTDYADSGTGKSGEPAYCTRRIVGVQPLDRYWLRVNYLVQLTHTNPTRDRPNRTRKSRSSGRNSTAGRHPWSGNGCRRRRSARKSAKHRVRRSGNDPDYNPGVVVHIWIPSVPIEYLPPSSDYLNGFLESVNRNDLYNEALIEARRRPARFSQAPTETTQGAVNEQQGKTQLIKQDILTTK
ncbi:unnamed protein product, partial [Echinostoma caproni]|uniref:Uncharacterized protein n=1 Tax=Echinostoma caproni TaxID=27848 RepID=A0A183B1A9_9TREM